MTVYVPPKTLATERLHTGRIFSIDTDHVVLPNGRETTLDVVRHPGSATIVPLLPNGDVVLVRQYRHPTGEWLLEVPAGTMTAGETPEECARREIVEESGFAADSWLPLGCIWTAPGFTDERIWLFLARNLRPAPQNLDDDEALLVERVPFDAAVAMALNGEISDAKSVCSLLRARAFLGRETGAA